MSSIQALHELLTALEPLLLGLKKYESAFTPDGRTLCEESVVLLGGAKSGSASWSPGTGILGYLNAGDQFATLQSDVGKLGRNLSTMVGGSIPLPRSSKEELVSMKNRLLELQLSGVLPEEQLQLVRQIKKFSLELKTQNGDVDVIESQLDAAMRSILQCVHAATELSKEDVVSEVSSLEAGVQSAWSTSPPDSDRAAFLSLALNSLQRLHAHQVACDDDDEEPESEEVDEDDDDEDPFYMPFASAFKLADEGKFAMLAKPIAVESKQFEIVMDDEPEGDSTAGASVAAPTAAEVLEVLPDVVRSSAVGPDGQPTANLDSLSLKDYVESRSLRPSADGTSRSVRPSADGTGAAAASAAAAAEGASRSVRPSADGTGAAAAAGGVGRMSVPEEGVLPEVQDAAGAAAAAAAAQVGQQDQQQQLLAAVAAAAAGGAGGGGPATDATLAAIAAAAAAAEVDATAVVAPSAAAVGPGGAPLPPDSDKLKQFVSFLDGENPGACMFHAQMRLSHEGCHKLANFLRSSNRVRALSLSHNFIGDAGLAIICDGLAANKSVTALDLPDNDISDEGIKHLVLAIQDNPALTQLQLAHNRIGDVGAAALAQIIKKSTGLKKLGVSHNCIGKAGCQALTAAISSNQSLKQLQLLPGNPVDEKDAKALAKALKHNTKFSIRTFLGLGDSQDKP